MHCRSNRLNMPGLILAAALFLSGIQSWAQANLPLYTDHLVNGFQNWSWGTLNFGNASMVNSGASSISLNGTAWNVALSLHQTPFDTSPYSTLSFWAHGGPAGGQILHIYARVNGTDTAGSNLSALPANTWQQYIVPLTTVGAANKTNVELFTLQLTSNGTTNAFYIDDIQLIAKPAPALVHLSIDATHPIRSADFRWAGFNTAIWDSNFDTATTISLFKEIGATILRFPGGSLSDEYHWASNKSGTNTWTWATSFANFVHIATNIASQAFITVNYGSGTPAEAASWVRYSNVTNHYGFKYWEVGNECYGTWETDTNNKPNDGYTYAQRAATYFQQMKAADPTIKIGIVVVPGEESYANGNTTHAATNLLNGQLHYGWTPVLLSTLKALGIVPDFAVHHRYPEYTASGSSVADSDALLLQSTSGWAGDAADLRRQIVAYFGPEGTNIELVCTENNSDAGSQGRQSTSLVNGLYYAESLAQLMKTELNAFVWWDFRNGSLSDGSFDPTLYGWRTVGDLGMIGNLSTKYPPFYAAKLMQYFAKPADTILPASSDYLLLQSYAARRASGALNLLVANRDSVTNFNAQVTVAGFIPDSVALVRSYGISQDEAARTNAAPASQDLATNTLANVSTSFNYSFPPLSLTLFTLPPAAPSVALLSAVTQPDGLPLLQLQGQANVRYVLQSSPDLIHWSNFSTNTLSTSTLNLGNPLTPGVNAQFYRALWQP